MTLLNLWEIVKIFLNSRKQLLRTRSSLALRYRAPGGVVITPLQVIYILITVMCILTLDNPGSVNSNVYSMLGADTLLLPTNTLLFTQCVYSRHRIHITVTNMCITNTQNIDSCELNVYSFKRMN